MSVQEWNGLKVGYVMTSSGSSLSRMLVLTTKLQCQMPEDILSLSVYIKVPAVHINRMPATEFSFRIYCTGSRDNCWNSDKGYVGWMTGSGAHPASHILSAGCKET